jgi:hypothetical protein
MAFMEPEIYKGQYYEVSANHGETYIVPVEAAGTVTTYGELADYVEGTIDEPEEPAVLLTGWLARLSAPGYMDCTDWTVCDSRAAAEEYLKETYGDDDDEENDD